MYNDGWFETKINVREKVHFGRDTGGMRHKRGGMYSMRQTNVCLGREKCSVFGTGKM